MKITLQKLIVRTRRTTEIIEFSDVVTYLFGPVSTGKSTVARLVDFCLGGTLERTPALQQEFVAAELELRIGEYYCVIERASDDTQSVRVNWSNTEGEVASINAPLQAAESPILDTSVYNLSDLIFYLAGTTPIKVRKRSRDPESPMIRLSIRDIWWYCYLDQSELDSSFFHLSDPFKGRKSQDVMRFFTGLYSDRLSQLENDLMIKIDEQRSKRQAVGEIRSFMSQFNLGTESQIKDLLAKAEEEIALSNQIRDEIEARRTVDIHPTDDLRNVLRQISKEIGDLQDAINDNKMSMSEQRALKAELITSKTKADRINSANEILSQVHFECCPECGTDLSERPRIERQCSLCGTPEDQIKSSSSVELELMRRDLNERIDQISESLERREFELERMVRQLRNLQKKKASLDSDLRTELARYDSDFIETIRRTDSKIAALEERIRTLKHLQNMPAAITAFEIEAGKLQGPIDSLRTQIQEERQRLSDADTHINAISTEFKRLMLSVGFPGVAEDDTVQIDPRNWKPIVIHGDQEWSFYDTGSGGKKTLFNVCYALAIHSVAIDNNLPVPSILIIDSPTKNISEDMNPEIVRSLYNEIYSIASRSEGEKIQFVLIDSEVVRPNQELSGYAERRMANEPDAPSLIPYYTGP